MNSETIQNQQWVQNAREQYTTSLASGCKDALRTLGLTDKRLGFDELRLARRIGLNASQVEDAYDMMMQARKIKTETELQLLRTAIDLNQQAITQTVQSWQKGMS